MAILTLGVSFRRAPIELLERLAFTDDDLAKAYRVATDLDGVDGAVILSTCNRVEVYGEVASYHAGFMALKRLLTETRGVAAEELADPMYAQWERDAADHLFAVASGLDSMVLGETQIYAQVREALRRAEAEGAAAPPLTGLFHSAARAGRRVRQETSLGAAPDAFVALGADLAEDAAGGLRRARRGRRRSGHDGRPGREAPAPARRRAGAHPEPFPRACEGARRADERRARRRSTCSPTRCGMPTSS